MNRKEVNMGKVIGIELVSYTNKNGKLIMGTRLHMTQELLSPSIGEKCFSEFVSGRSASEFHLGEFQTVLYEPTGFGSYRCTGVLYLDKK